MMTVGAFLPGTKIVVASPPPLPPVSALARVESLWQAEHDKRGAKLFNGKIFSVAEMCEPGVITGWLADYKWFVAQQCDQSLYPALLVRPLAITGIVACDDSLVFGRRAGTVQQDAWLWELAPSGGVDGSFRYPDGTIDLAEQLLVELTEELGIGAAMISAPPQPFAVVYDNQSHVCDVGISARTVLPKLQVISAFSSVRSPEHAALKIVPEAGLENFVRKLGEGLSPVSAALLKARRTPVTTTITLGKCP